MSKLLRKSYVYDVMHMTLVTGLIGLGAFTGGLLVYKTYEYFTGRYHSMSMMYLNIFRNENVDIKFSAHDTFLE
jgi:hypothetical protein